MIEGGGLADEQGVELQQSGVVGAGDQLHVDPQAGAGADEVLERLLARRRQLFLGIAEDGQGIAGRRLALAFAPCPGGVSVESLQKRRHLVRLQVADRPGADRGDFPPVAVAEIDGQDGAMEQLEGAPSHLPQPGVVRHPEEDVDGERGLLLRRRGERRSQQLVDLGQGDAQQPPPVQVEHHLGGGDHLLPPRLGEQRAVVAAAQVAVVAAQVDYP